MDELFGIPMSAVVTVLGILFSIVFAVLLYIFVRNRLAVRMAARNVPRRKAQSALIIAGLMMATVTISSAFTTGDSVAISIETVATEDLRHLDQFVRVDDDSNVWEGRATPDEFDEALFSKIGPVLQADPGIDGVAPLLFEGIAVINFKKKLFEINGVLTGVDSEAASDFDDLETTDGDLVDLRALAAHEVYIDREGAAQIGVVAGDIVGIPVGPGVVKEFRVRAVTEGFYAKRPEDGIVVMMGLDRAQELTGKVGLLSGIMVSNVGEGDAGLASTDVIQERLADLPIFRDNGLELFPLKKDLVEIANTIGSVFVSLFTFFGLFSIGVGILLIFLIFSMLAAERKSEMGMSRAIGMRRSQLVQTFIAEGAIYSIGSAVVGTLIGAAIGSLLVIGVSGAFTQNAPGDSFNLAPAVSLRSLLVSFFLGSLVTFITVGFASFRVSRLNIVRAIRDLPEPQRLRAGIGTLVWGLILSTFGALVLLSGLGSAQLTLFTLGCALLPIGVALSLRFFGVAPRLLLTAVGVWLLVLMLPIQHPSVIDAIKDDWKSDFSIFLVSSFLLVIGAVLVLMNNTQVLHSVVGWFAGRFVGLAPVIKWAAAYPLSNGFRTGVSVLMFAVVVLSITTISVINASFGDIIEDQQRLAGGYDVVGVTTGDLNPIPDSASVVQADSGLSFVSRDAGAPQIGTFRKIGFEDAEAKLPWQPDSAFDDTPVTGVDPDFVRTNDFKIELATEEFANENGFDQRAVWEALAERPGTALINAEQVPSRSNFVFGGVEGFNLNDVEGFFAENEVMDPIPVTVLDLESGVRFDITVIGVIDSLASGFFVPMGIYVSTDFLTNQVGRAIDITSVWFEVEPGTLNADRQIESAFFPFALETISIEEEIADSQAANSDFNTLLQAYMGLGLVVGIAALGVISARSVIERRHQIGVLRAIGFSRWRVQLSFLLESSFIAILGIGLGIGLSLLQTNFVIGPSISSNEPQFVIAVPWTRVIVIAVLAYLFTFLTTVLPSRQAAKVPPAEALRYE